MTNVFFSGSIDCMNTEFTIQGGTRLNGEISIPGNKNATTPLLAASLLIQDTVVLDNVPRIADVQNMIRLLQTMHVKIDWTAENQLTINTTDADITQLDEDLVKSMRSSVLFLGPLLSRFHSVTLPEPGGCTLGNRPLGTHYVALQQLGAAVNVKKTCVEISAKKLKASEIILPEFSVTATENAIMAAVLLSGKTIIKGAAIEPHVQELISFLNDAGAKIELKPQHRIEITGVKKLHSVSHRIAGDPNEFAALAVLGALAADKIVIHGVRPDHNEMVMLKLADIGVNFTVSQPNKNNEVSVTITKSSKKYKAVDIQALPFPGFPTDAQSPFTVLATQAEGTSLIHDPLYESRLIHVPDLIKMGAEATVCDPHRVMITGPTPLVGQNIKSFNIRAGATLMIAGIIAKGETVICDGDIIDRGYQELDQRLNALGAKISREES